MISRYESSERKRGEQEKGSTEEKDKLLEAARKKKTQEHVREQARYCRMKTFFFPSLFCMAWLYRLPGLLACIQPRGDSESP